jgi:hypothetical protein
VPDSYGKRQRDAVKARKAVEREERRLARRRRRDGLEIAPWEAEAAGTDAGPVDGVKEGEGEEAEPEHAHANDADDAAEHE